MPNLITNSEYRLYAADSAPTSENTRIDALIAAASRSVTKYTDRNFVVTTGVSAPRTYEYDGSGFLEIDDCQNILTITTDAGYPGQTYVLDTSEWLAEPAGGEVYYYVHLNGRYLPASPEMGFERNLDTLGYSGRIPNVTVTATWGWPAIPEDVKLATAIIVADLKESSKEGAGELTAESIASYARSWQPRPSQLLAIPNRARDLLANYMRVYG